MQHMDWCPVKTESTKTKKGGKNVLIDFKYTSNAL